MANFESSLNKLIVAEGGYKLTRLPTEEAVTYAGIYRQAHPRWPGWAYVDRNETPPTQLVRDFYREEFWNKIQGDSIESDELAHLLFDFAVNTSYSVSNKLAQVILGLQADGVVGPKTIKALNEVDVEYFVLKYSIAKIARYRDIVTKNPAKKVFLLGWVNRVLAVLGG
jgi:lysozyme family protein